MHYDGRPQVEQVGTNMDANVTRITLESQPLGIVEVQLTRGFLTIIDADSLASIQDRKWSALCAQKWVYAVSRVSGKVTYLHRHLLSAPAGMTVDHINGNTLDNRLSNLRICTVSQNARNARVKPHSSQFKGVHRLRPGFFQVRARGGYVGTYRDEVEAARAYDRKALELFGEFARTNFPREKYT
jgi:hypothetical protein